MAEYIEREALREAFIKHFEAFYDDGKLVFSDHICTAEDCEDILKMVAELPTVDVVPVEWISVKDSLPDNEERVLVAVDSDKSDTKIDTDRMIYRQWVRWGMSVTHWKPLPEPPQKEGVDNE